MYMETKQLKRLPIGIQTFSIIIEENMLYVDKTEYIWKMIHASNYIFLNRPRRFGKSLLISTLQAYFEGRKELFKGLAIEQLEQEWTEYPVLRFDMSTAKHFNKADLELELSNKLTAYEAVYGQGAADQVKPNQRLQGLIERPLRVETEPECRGSHEADRPEGLRREVRPHRPPDSQGRHQLRYHSPHPQRLVNRARLKGHSMLT